ncbi:MAG: deoxyguanosinetriphosphate triphosphohydrolase, partial [Acidimicrobiia bacterium]
MTAFRLRTRETAEALERDLLAPGATMSSASRGRAVPEEPDPWRTVFERDHDRILHSKAFRRLKHKT